MRRVTAILGGILLLASVSTRTRRTSSAEVRRTWQFIKVNGEAKVSRGL